MIRLSWLVMAVTACGAVKSTPDGNEGIDSPHNTPITPARVAVTPNPIAGGPVTCTIVTPASGGSGTITDHATWTLDNVAFANTSTTTFTDDTIPGNQTHTGHVFACTVVSTDGQSTAMSTPASATIVGRFAFVINDGTTSLMKIDLDTNTLTNIGALGVQYEFGDLAWDRATQTLFMVDGRTTANTRALYKVNITTGAATLVGSHGQTDMFALAVDPISGKLFGAVKGTVAPTLFTLNKVTGAASPVGGTTSYEGLAFDTQRSLMIAIQTGAAAISSVNTANGATQQLASPGGTNDSGMTYDPFIDRFWVADLNGNLFQYDPNNGFARITAKTFTGNGFTGIAIQLPPP
jgi:hypothetical protein